MKSPFPGMDPFIEASGLWEDFHDKLVMEIERTLAPLLPERYVVRAGERSYVVLIDEGHEERHQMRPDVVVSAAEGIWESGSPGEPAQQATSAVAVAPIRMRALVEQEFRETFLEIYEMRPQRRLVTGIEILSPPNKQFRSPGWQQYLRKRQAFVEGGANFVEIDLLRGGARMPMLGEWPNTPYYFLVSRKEEAPLCHIWPASSLAPLPGFSIPLLSPDADVQLDLQPLVTAIYARSRYFYDIDYHAGSSVPLDADESEFLDHALREKS